MTKHTSGPWVLEYEKDGAFTLRASDVRGTGLVICQRNIETPNPHEGTANAYLICAAPLLRDALSALIGAETREELLAMEFVIRSSVAPAADKAASINAIHALLATIPANG